MPPLYPKMRERPPEFRVNRAWPFVGNIKLGVVPPRVWSNVGYYNYQLRNVLNAPSIVYVPHLRRHAIYFPNVNKTDYYTITAPFSMSDLGLGRRFLAVTWAWASPDIISTTWLGDIISDFTTWPSYQGATFNRIKWSTNAMESYIYPGDYRATSAKNFLARSTWMFLTTRGAYNSLAVYRDDILGASTSLGGNIGSGTTLKIGNRGDLGSGDGNTYIWVGYVTDVLLLDTDNMIISRELADPSNIDLRIGGIPLILPPRRRFWPVVSEQAIPKMVPWHLFQQVSA